MGHFGDKFLSVLIAFTRIETDVLTNTILDSTWWCRRCKWCSSVCHVIVTYT